MKVTYDEKGNVISVEDNTLKWLCISFAIMFASFMIGGGIMLL